MASIHHPWILMLAAVTSLVTSRPLQVVDLTYSLGSHTVFWPGQPPFNFTVLTRGHQPTGFWLEVNAFGLGEHGGTHIDAPSHFVKDHWRVHQIPASHLVGPGVVVDVEDKVKANADYEMTKEDLMKWEEEHGRIPDAAVVLMHTGWGSRYPDPKKVFNTMYPEDPRTYHFPGLHPEAARWMSEERNITAMGTDTPSPDRGSGTGNYPVHATLLGKNILILEYVANLKDLPPRGATIVIGIVKLKEGSGGPARILGLLDADAGSGSAPPGGCSVAGLMMALWIGVGMLEIM